MKSLVHNHCIIECDLFHCWLNPCLPHITISGEYSQGVRWWCDEWLCLPRLFVYSRFAWLKINSRRPSQSFLQGSKARENTSIYSPALTTWGKSVSIFSSFWRLLSYLCILTFVWFKFLLLVSCYPGSTLTESLPSNQCQLLHQLKLRKIKGKREKLLKKAIGTAEQRPPKPFWGQRRGDPWRGITWHVIWSLHKRWVLPPRGWWWKHGGWKSRHRWMGGETSDVLLGSQSPEFLLSMHEL